MQLDSLVRQVAVIEKLIADLRFTMRHASPASVNALRIQKEELEEILNELMESCVISNFDLEYMLSRHGECLRDCFRPSYTGRPITLPKPKWDTPPPPPPEEVPLPTVPGVNLILYIDSTASMNDDLGTNGKLRKELQALANYLASESTRGGIPCTVTLVWFGDASEGDGRNTYYSFSMVREDVSGLAAKLGSPKRYRGGMNIPESGILALKETLPYGIKHGVANTLIYITDAPSKVNEFGATPEQVRQMFADYSIQAYGIVPYKEPDIRGIFSDTRDITRTPYNITSWADKTLRP